MSVATKHREYVAYEYSWQAIRASYAGSGMIKGAYDTRAVQGYPNVRLAGTKYLPMPSGMGLAQYEGYRDRAVFYAATARAVHGLTGAVFRKEPQVVAPHSLDRQLEDVTQTGVPLRSFAEQTVRETLLMGRHGILVDFPRTDVVVPGSTPIAVPRPYWVSYCAEEIYNWRTMQRQGDTILSLVVLKECVPVVQGVWPSETFFTIDEQVQYRVLRINEQGVYEVSLWLEEKSTMVSGTPTARFLESWIPLRQGQPLDFIPFVFLAPFSLEPAVQPSVLEGLVEINFQYYRHSADYEHALHLTALPTPYVCSSAESPGDLLIGSATAWWIPDSQAKVGMLAIEANALGNFERAMTADIQNMAAVGARLLEGTPNVQETATAILTRTEGAESPVQSLVTTVSQGLTQALQLHAWWAGSTDNPDDTNIHIQLNKDLVAATMAPQMLTALMQALLNGTISYETWWYNLQRGEIARPMVEAEDEQTLLEVRQQQQPLVTPANPSPGGPASQNGRVVQAA